MTKTTSTICAIVILAIGMTATAGQTTCPTPLGDLYPKFPANVKTSSAEGAKACADTAHNRQAAHQNFADAAKNLGAVIADKNSSALAIIEAKLRYIDTEANIDIANQPMHGPNTKATMAYFDWVIARQKAGTPFDETAETVFEKWQGTANIAEAYPALDKQLLQRADEARQLREKAESARLDELRKVGDEMLRQDREMMRRDMSPATKQVCADGSTPADGFCADGSVPQVVKK